MNGDDVQNRRQPCCIIVNNNSSNNKPTRSPSIIRLVIMTDDDQGVETDDGEDRGRDVESGYDDADVEDDEEGKASAVLVVVFMVVRLNKILLPDVFGR